MVVVSAVRKIESGIGLPPVYVPFVCVFNKKEKPYSQVLPSSLDKEKAEMVRAHADLVMSTLCVQYNRITGGQK